MSGDAPSGPRVAVVGGGLAGLAAAVALSSAGCRVELFEARRSLGGRAGSFRDPASGELIDHCQHVSMGCCTNLADFCRRTGIDSFLKRDETLTFVGPAGQHCAFRATSWLPAPLHLAPAFWRLRYLAPRDRLAVARAMYRLMRLSPAKLESLTVGQWLAQQRQSTAALDYFWSVILVSALGEELDRASLAAARKVLVDGFLAARDAYVLEIPQVPLAALYGQPLVEWFAAHQVTVHLEAPLRQFDYDEGPILRFAEGDPIEPSYAVLALPWHKLPDVMSPRVRAQCPMSPALAQAPGTPITGVHLWFDRPITELPHAVLVGRLSQWLFNRGWRDESADFKGHYYQVVISASRSLAGRNREEIVAQVCAELAAIWPQAAEASLRHARVVTEQAAVFSISPEFERVRPSQQTPLPRMFVAGDWTNTGWPATMEGAVRSGYLAAEAILRAADSPQKFLRPDLPRGLLARLLIKA